MLLKVSPNRSPPPLSLSLSQREVELKSLLASEVVRLLCLVTQFFSQITTHPGTTRERERERFKFCFFSGLLQLVCVATSNPQAGDIISDVIWKVQARGVRMYIDYFLHKIILLLIAENFFVYSHCIVEGVVKFCNS